MINDRRNRKPIHVVIEEQAYESDRLNGLLNAVEEHKEDFEKANKDSLRKAFCAGANLDKNRFTEESIEKEFEKFYKKYKSCI